MELCNSVGLTFSKISASFPHIPIQFEFILMSEHARRCYRIFEKLIGDFGQGGGMGGKQEEKRARLTGRRRKYGGKKDEDEEEETLSAKDKMGQRPGEEGE